MAVIYVCDLCNKEKKKYYYTEFGYEGENELICQTCFNKANPTVYIYDSKCTLGGSGVVRNVELRLEKVENYDEEDFWTKLITELPLHELAKKTESEELDIGSEDLGRLLIHDYAICGDEELINELWKETKHEK